MASCIQCGSPLPSNQGSRTCSMCYGDIDHGKDGYYRAEMADDIARAIRNGSTDKEQIDDIS